MTIEKNPGVYLEETVNYQVNVNTDNIPMFLVQTSTEIPELDGQLVRFSSVAAFEALVEGKGLSRTIMFLKNFWKEIPDSDPVFYVYSVKGSTNEAFKTAILETVNRDEIKSYFYFEEIKSSGDNGINLKCTAIKEAVELAATNAHPGIAYVIPYGTVQHAVNNKGENDDAKTVAITTSTSISQNIRSGRVCVVFPEDYTGVTAGKAFRTPYNEDVGLTSVNVAIPSLKYQLTSSEMLTLLNAGILFLVPRIVDGEEQYNIHMGVTTSFVINGADGYLISRRIADELLSRVIAEAKKYIKIKDSGEGVTFLNSDIKAIVSEFVANKDVVKANTSLKAVDGVEPYTIDVVGSIDAYKCVTMINIKSTLK